MDRVTRSSRHHHYGIGSLVAFIGAIIIFGPTNHILSAQQPAPTIDAVASGDRSGANTVTTSGFSTTAGNELLLAFVASADASPGNTVTGITGGGLNWQLVVRTNGQRGTSEVWRAFASSALTNITATATTAQFSSVSMTVVSFKGVDTTGSNGAAAIGAIRSASGATGAPISSITTTRSGRGCSALGTTGMGERREPLARTSR